MHSSQETFFEASTALFALLKAHHIKGTYTDEQIIGLMQEVALGKLDFKSVQNIIEGSKSYES